MALMPSTVENDVYLVVSNRSFKYEITRCDSYPVRYRAPLPAGLGTAHVASSVPQVAQIPFLLAVIAAPGLS